MAAIVYLATNLVNGKRYVGVTGVSLAMRRYKHEWQALRGSAAKTQRFHRAIKKYGVANFSWIVLRECESFEGALEEEILLIASLRPEYNISAGGNAPRGYRRSEQSKLLQSQKMKGRTLSAAAIARIVAKNTGRKRTPEQRQRMSASRKGKPFTEQHKASLRESRARQKFSPETREKLRLAGLARYAQNGGGLLCRIS